MNGWLKTLAVAVAATLIAVGSFSQQVTTNTKQIEDVAKAARENAAVINQLAKDQSTMAANIEWIRKTLERPNSR